MGGEINALLTVFTLCSYLRAEVRGPGLVVRHERGCRIITITDTMERMSVYGREDETRSVPDLFASAYGHASEGRTWSVTSRDGMIPEGELAECRFWETVIDWLKPEPILLP